MPAPADILCFELELFTRTCSTQVDGVLFNEEALDYRALQLTPGILAVNSNYGHVALEGHERHLKRPSPPVVKPGRRVPPKQGDGSCFNSCISVTCQVPPAFVGRVPRIKREYKGKLFRNGSGQIYGVLMKDQSDGLAVLQYLVDFIRANAGFRALAPGAAIESVEAVDAAADSAEAEDTTEAEEAAEAGAEEAAEAGAEEAAVAGAEEAAEVGEAEEAVEEEAAEAAEAPAGPVVKDGITVPTAEWSTRTVDVEVKTGNGEVEIVAMTIPVAPTYVVPRADVAPAPGVAEALPPLHQPVIQNFKSVINMPPNSVIDLSALKNGVLRLNDAGSTQFPVGICTIMSDRTPKLQFSLLLPVDPADLKAGGKSGAAKRAGSAAKRAAAAKRTGGAQVNEPAPTVSVLVNVFKSGKINVLGITALSYPRLGDIAHAACDVFAQLWDEIVVELPEPDE